MATFLIHGCCEEAEFFGEGPSPSNNHWLPWLQKQLIRTGTETQTPEMPTPYKPNYPEWKRVFSTCPVDSTTTLVGHSCGGGFLVRWLSEEGGVSVQRLVLAAPWIDPFGTRGAFLDFTPDPRLNSRVAEVHLLYSDDDVVEGVRESVEILSRLFPGARHHRFPDK